ncbi:MAG: dihydrodipicolinate synthase family protein, partial [Proteobacteria bacterium]|nr:dihydrodipicolinate synthase family protein [Pseudomonadota bacterium]
MKLDTNARGVFVIAPTPFHPDGRVDDASIDRMTDFFVQAGADGLTMLGQLGEAAKMAHGESVDVVRRVVRRTRLPVIVGV